MENCYTNFYGLIFNCPVENEESNCVFKEIRLLTSKEKIYYYHALTDKEKMALIAKHQRCLAIREKKNVPFLRITIM